MSQAAAFITCQMPLKSGLPSAVRGSVLPGVCARATETGAANNKTIEATVTEAGRRYGMGGLIHPVRIPSPPPPMVPRPSDRGLRRGDCTIDERCNTRIDLPRVQLEDFLLVTGIERGDLVDVPLGVVEIVTGLGIYPPHGTHHL